MARIDNLNSGELAAITRRIRALEMATPLANASISRGALTIKSPEGLIVDGSARVSGTLSVTGTETVTGTLNVSGTETVTGTLNVDGPLLVDGATSLRGPTTITGDVTVNGSGSITVAGATPATLGVTSLGLPGLEFSAGNALISSTDGLLMKSGTTGGRVAASSGVVSMAYGTKSVAISGTQITLTGTTVVSGSFSATTKSFKIPHPIKEDTWLVHGVTESPVHGVEYTAVGTFDPNGECVVMLPDYFEALTKTEGRTVLITPIGKPYPVGADLPSGGTFTAYGEAGRSFSWLVKAARSGVDFDVEQAVEVTR
ncbi:hypothetical protein E3T54_03510 [Cryobacterium sp. Sr8]|uniref:hypothetical protein n=1 Tax=Cryobacterium sp. Sr8 TaxID=1259203 RepID=UPI0010697446|nr:hypothetical protein [Cryobacterium sp. Sr8]TFD80308.1 hypothetical protein E3T54_03510 [Cryobacterium sp. Sr8]